MSRRRLPLMCPSSNIDEPRASLLGVPTADGGLQFAKAPIPITAEFREIAKRGRDPGKRFRFTTPCIQGGCAHWQESRCIVADIVTDEVAPAAPTPSFDPEKCPIRHSCRWRHQRGDAACAVCPDVLANILMEESA